MITWYSPFKVVYQENQKLMVADLGMPPSEVVGFTKEKLSRFLDAVDSVNGVYWLGSDCRPEKDIYGEQRANQKTPTDLQLSDIEHFKIYKEMCQIIYWYVQNKCEEVVLQIDVSRRSIYVLDLQSKLSIRVAFNKGLNFYKEIKALIDVLNTRSTYLSVIANIGINYPRKDMLDLAKLIKSIEVDHRAMTLFSISKTMVVDFKRVEEFV